MIDSFIVGFIAFLWCGFLIKILSIERCCVKNDDVPAFMHSWKWFFERKNPIYWGSVSKSIFLKFAISIICRSGITVSLLYIGMKELKIDLISIQNSAYGLGIMIILFFGYINNAIQRLGNRLFLNDFYSKTLSSDLDTNTNDTMEKIIQHMDKLQKNMEFAEKGKNQLQDIMVETNSSIIKVERTVEVQQTMLIRMGESFLEFQKMLRIIEDRINFSEMDTNKNSETIKFMASTLNSILESLNKMKENGMEEIRGELKSFLKPLALAIARRNSQ